jgi:hypothetical protein
MRIRIHNTAKKSTYRQSELTFVPYLYQYYCESATLDLETWMDIFFGMCTVLVLLWLPLAISLDILIEISLLDHTGTEIGQGSKIWGPHRKIQIKIWICFKIRFISVTVRVKHILLRYPGTVPVIGEKKT